MAQDSSWSDSLLQPSSIYTILSFDYIEPVIIERKRAVLPREFQAVLDEFHRTIAPLLQIQAQQSCIITITGGGQSENKVFPESGSAVTIKLGNKQEIAGHSMFTGEVLNHGGREHPNQIRMLVVLPAGPGFVLSAPTGSWRAYFRFDLYGGQGTRTRKALQILTVHRPNSWLTRLFLGHAPLDPLSHNPTRNDRNFK
ncbi:MAG: hypothetical protein LQ348_005204 [Seirophora lacunosa]|nr:MAG: hypothetical protein LQ348_005204 [Seirophora lacunosa]